MSSPTRKAFERWLSQNAGATLEEAFTAGASPPVGGAAPDLNAPEPPPVGDGAEVWPLVIKDMRARDAAGLRKYGTPLRAHNGRKPLVDLYQELLDAVVYCRQHIEEQSARPTVGGEPPESLSSLARRIRTEHKLAEPQEDIATKPFGAIGWTLNQLNNRCVSMYDKVRAGGVGGERAGEDERFQKSLRGFAKAYKRWVAGEPATPIQPDVQTAVGPEAVDDVLASAPTHAEDDRATLVKLENLCEAVGSDLVEHIEGLVASAPRPLRTTCPGCGRDWQESSSGMVLGDASAGDTHDEGPHAVVGEDRVAPRSTGLGSAVERAGDSRGDRHD